MPNLPEHALIATLRAEIPELLAIYLFGSHVQGTQGPESDVDLAVMSDSRLEPVALWNIAQTLAMQIHKDVDLINLRTASTVMQYQIITTGRRIWQKDSRAAIFECEILTDKLDLDAWRAGLLDDIRRDGTVYGATTRYG